MSRFYLRPLCAALALSMIAAPLFAERWRVQYFYDENKAVFRFTDIQFPSATRGVAVGVIEDGKKEKPASVVTTDGGAHWQVVNLEETPVSLFFLTENLGWMVTQKGLWQTTETGKNWRKLPKLPPQIVRVCFIDEKNGFAVGMKKKVFATHDGGQHWDPVVAAAEPPGNPDYSAYTWIAFAGPKVGMITGFNMPPRRSFEQQRLPEWMDPERAISQRDTPHLSYSLATADGGKTWKASSASLFGQVTKVRVTPDGNALGLLEHSNSFAYPSEVYKVDWRTGKSSTVYRDKRFAVSDIWLTPDGSAYLAGSIVNGKIRNVIPGKVQVLQSRDLSFWREIEVDYRATANRVTFAVADEANMWMATDEGMILKLMK